MKALLLPRFEEIGFNWEGHKEAWRFIHLMYVTPGLADRLVFDYRGFIVDRWAQIRGGFVICSHLWPWVVLLCAVARIPSVAWDATPLDLWGIALAVAWKSCASLAIGLTVGIAVSTSFGLPGGIAVGIAGVLTAAFSLGMAESLALSMAGAISYGLVVGLAYGLTINIARGISGSIAFGVSVGIGGGLSAGLAGYLVTTLFGAIVYGLGYGVGVGITGAIAGGRASGLIGGLAICVFGASAVGSAYGVSAGVAGGLGFGFTCFRLYYLPFHQWCLHFADNRMVDHWHPVFWDGNLLFSLPRLEVLLVAHAERHGEANATEIERIVEEMPSQRSGALKALTIILLRRSAHAATLSDAALLLNALPEGQKGYLKETGWVKAKLERFVENQGRANGANRPYFREVTLHQLRNDIAALRSEATGYQEPLRAELRRAAEAWLILVDHQLIANQANRAREQTPQVFRAGDPVLREEVAFVSRFGLMGDLESEILSGTGCPGVLIYGRRRLGKSTLLRNLDGLLPESVRTAVLSMQNPEVFSSHSHFCTQVCQEIGRTCPEIALRVQGTVDLAAFFGVLRDWNERLRESGTRLIIAIDEFEGIDACIGQGRFTEDLLATLRESIQQHRQITWMLAGSHHFSELKHVRWSNYLVSMRTMEVPLFSREETHQLLTDPMRHARIGSDDKAGLPFATDFWHEGGIDLIHEQSGGWPHLVQLLAAAVVDSCNTSGLKVTTPEVLEMALTKVVTSGSTTLSELMLYKSDEYPTAWQYLENFRIAEVQPPPEDNDLRRLLKRHLLVIDGPIGGLQLRVPMMRRWLQEKM